LPDLHHLQFGPEIEEVPSFKRRAHFKPYALGGVDAHGPSDNPPFYTLATLMAQNNHTFIDILKIDIEGAEFEALEALIDAYPSASSSAWDSDKGKGGRIGNGLPFGQLQLEVHVRDNGPWSYFPKFLLWWEKLEKAGLRPFWTEPNLVYVNLVRGVRPDLAEVNALIFPFAFTTDVLRSIRLSTSMVHMSLSRTATCHTNVVKHPTFAPPPSYRQCDRLRCSSTVDLSLIYFSSISSQVCPLL
jgi:hypothetical protein